MRVGTVIKKLREEKGLSQQALAKKAKVTDAYIAMLETGVRRNPTIYTLRRLAKALGVSVDELLGEQRSIRLLEQVSSWGEGEERRPTMAWDEAVMEAVTAKGKYWSFRDIYPEVEALMGERWGKIANPKEAVRATVYALRKQGLVAGTHDTYTVTDDGKRQLQWRREWKRHEPEIIRLWKSLTLAQQQAFMESLHQEKGKAERKGGKR